MFGVMVRSSMSSDDGLAAEPFHDARPEKRSAALRNSHEEIMSVDGKKESYCGGQRNHRHSAPAAWRRQKIFPPIRQRV